MVPTMHKVNLPHCDPSSRASLRGEAQRPTIGNAKRNQEYVDRQTGS
jgi:hypothetical protein